MAENRNILPEAIQEAQRREQERVQQKRDLTSALDKLGLNPGPFAFAR